MATSDLCTNQPVSRVPRVDGVEAMIQSSGDAPQRFDLCTARNAKAFALWRFGKHSKASIAPTINSTNAWAIHTNLARGRQRNPSQIPGM